MSISRPDHNDKKNSAPLNADNENYARDAKLELSKSKFGEDTHERATLIRAICHDVFPETTRRLGSGDKYRNMVSVFSEASTDRAKKALYGKPQPSDFNLLEWLQSIKIDIGLKIEFLQIVARQLGDDWCDDSRTFLDVTIAMSRLQVALRRLCQLELASSDFQQMGSAIIVVPPGEAHQFGQCIVEELFSTRGWNTELFVPNNTAELVEHIVRAKHDIVCISWSTSALSSIVKKTINAIEKSEAVYRPAIIAGGNASLEGGNWLVNLGVDYICDSAYSAMNMAESLIVKSNVETTD